MNTMIKKSRLALAIGVTGALGLGAGSAMAADFQASVEVQNTVAVDNIANLNFGTVSVAAAAGVDGDADAGDVAVLLLAPDGDGSTETATSDDTQVDIVALGGSGPAEALVVSSTDFIIEFPVGSWVDALDDNGSLATPDPTQNFGQDVVDNGIQLSDADGNPGIPDFYLVNFRVGELSSGSVEQDIDTDTEWNVETEFDTEQVEFFIGGTLVTDPESDDDYQDTTYEGEFEVTARF